MNIRSLIIYITAFILLAGVIVYLTQFFRDKKDAERVREPQTTLETQTVRTSRSYRLEDNLSVPSERTVPLE